MRAAISHVDMGAEESQIRSNTFRNITIDSFYGVQRVDGLIFLEVNSSQAVDSLIAHLFFDIAFDDPRNRPSGAVVHPVCQLKIADSEFSVVDMVVKRVEFRFIESVELSQFHIEPGDRIEPLSPESTVQGLSEIEIL